MQQLPRVLLRFRLQRSRFYARPLPLARVPDIARCEPVEAFTPGYLRMRLAVDIHVEVVAKWEPEAICNNVTIAGYKAGEHCLT